MTPWRMILALAAASVVGLALGNLTLWHASVWIPIAFYGMVVCALAVFEVGRYRPRVDRTATTWRETGERFHDPVTGESTTVYYDPVSGKRDYRRS
jgi:hypothetical protein